MWLRAPAWRLTAGCPSTTTTLRPASQVSTRSATLQALRSQRPVCSPSPPLVSSPRTSAHASVAVSSASATKARAAATSSSVAAWLERSRPTSWAARRPRHGSWGPLESSLPKRMRSPRPGDNDGSGCKDSTQVGLPRPGGSRRAPTGPSFGLAWLYRTDAVGPHHLVVLVLDDMAVPYELTRCFEPRPHPRDLPRIGDDRVLEPRFPRLGTGDVAVELDRLGGPL